MASMLSAMISPAYAHHVLGRPSYSLNEDSNTPPSMQIETRIGNYFVTYMVYPAFPKPGEPGRINLYALSIKDNKLSNPNEYVGGLILKGIYLTLRWDTLIVTTFCFIAKAFIRAFIMK